VNKANDIYELEKMANTKDKRRRHVSQIKKFNPPTVAVTALAIICLLQPVWATTLQEALPIFWVEDKEHYVSKGEDSAAYVIHYLSPCNQLLEYGRRLLFRLGGVEFCVDPLKNHSFGGGRSD